MDGINLIILGVVMFIVIVIALVLLILLAKSKFVATGNAKIDINDDPEKTIEVPVGDKLLYSLGDAGIYLPSACGGQGTCAECRCIITEGGGDVLATETGKLSRGEIKAGYRLSCQVPVKTPVIY